MEFIHNLNKTGNVGPLQTILSSVALKLCLATQQAMELKQGFMNEHTKLGVFQVAVKYHLFREGKENALNIFNQFFNRVLAHNAANCHEDAPADFKTTEDIAKEVMAKWNCPTQPPVFGDILNHGTNFARVDSDASGVGSLLRDQNTNRGNGSDYRQQSDHRGNGSDYRPQPDPRSRNVQIVENGACHFGEVKYQHLCAIVTAFQKNGTNVLCAKEHAPKDHR